MSPSIHTPPAEALRRDPVVAGAIQNLVAAAGQIAAVMRDPAVSILNSAHAFQISSSVRAAAELNVAEILRDAGPQGLHVKEIAAKGNVDPKLLARILRLLATHHIFREVSTDVFANNRISSTMDKGKPADVLYAKPEERLLETNGLSALVEFISEEAFKASAYMTDTMLDPAGPPTAHMRAFRTNENMFQWFENPANKARLTRFGIAMQGSAAEEPEDTIFRGFKWDSLPAGSVIVDVGGGLGASSLSIVKKYPQLKVVNQDRGPVIEQSKAHWKEFLPSHVEAGLVEFQAHNFLEPQPVTDAAAFLVRHVVHDWSDTNVVLMLTHLRAAARPDTKLVIIENIAATACTGGSESNTSHPHINAIPILGAPRSPAAPPLLANYGMAGVPLYYYDLTVHNLLGGTERTLEGFYDVLLQAGWKLVEVWHCPQTDSSYVIADPIV
ncbi:S-adenosyl-L-methionine-dependent methyltransferase [Mycena venus]|uniref:S-adenosyl-L-methionine-dependent methyltransferase n=1 Tax=Mycena venus TaxID=2733690 RepID=A0A8H6Y4F6_9AGAR|nr:S-adenosyl-L-methionine-dependent methyltransferase [Mycena venus]